MIPEEGLAGPGDPLDQTQRWTACGFFVTAERSERTVVKVAGRPNLPGEWQVWCF